MKYSLHPSILTSFWLGLLALQTKTPYPQIEADLPLQLQPVYRMQTRLRWDKLYYGWVTTHWEQAIDALHPHLPVSG